MSSEDWSIVSYEEAEDDSVVLSPEFTTSALVNALHDSPLRSANASRCSFGTHVTPKIEFSTWLAKYSPRTSARVERSRFNLLWLHGPAGTGKTTLMQTLADALLPTSIKSVSVSENNNTGPPTYETIDLEASGVQYGGAAVFFSKENQLTDPIKFFTTIAFGIAERLPELAFFIQSAFDANKHLFQHFSGRSLLKEQATVLIFQPIQAWVASEEGDVDVDFIILVDGLNECGEPETQADIINVVRDVFTKKIAGVCWSWVFSSRMDENLREVLAGGSAVTYPKAEEIVLGLASEAEIDAFLDSRFAEIRGTHPIFRAHEDPSQTGASLNTAPPSTEEEWPSAHDKAVIKWQAAGLYAAASSILDFIGDPHDDPRSRIVLVDSIIGNNNPGLDHPYTKLDNLYKDILSRIPPDTIPQTKRILGAISCLQPSTQNQVSPTIALIAELFDIKAKAVHQSLRHLQSVISISPKLPPSPSAQPVSPRRARPRFTHDEWLNEELEFWHPSFNQFLRSPSRSENWGLNLESIHLDLARCCLNKLISGCSSPLKKYLDERWYIHCWRTGTDTEAAFSILPELFEFDYTLLDSTVIDRYFVEWLLHLQETTMSEYQLLNPGPLVELRLSKVPEQQLPSDEDPGSEVGPSSSSSSHDQREKEKKSPPRQSYILGIESPKQVYLVPFYDHKVQLRPDIGQVIGPGLKYWDWIRGFKVIPQYLAESEDLEAIEESMAQIAMSESRRTANNDAEGDGEGCSMDELILRVGKDND